MAEITQEIDGSEASYDRLKEYFVSSKTAHHILHQKLRSEPKFLIGQVRTLQDQNLALLVALSNQLLATEKVLVWAKRAIEKRDEEFEKTIITFRNFVKRYTPILDEVEKDYGRQLEKVDKS